MTNTTPPPPAKRAAIYLRVSTAAQVDTGGDEDGLSIAAQREACLKKAKSMSAEVVDEYVDRGESARSAHRPALQLLLERLRTDKDLDYVICHKLDRMARNRADDVEIELTIRRAGAQLVSVSENIDDTPSGILLHGVIAAVAEFYSANLAAEVRKGMDQKAKRGIKPGKAPIGYLNTGTEIAGRPIRTITRDPELADTVTWCLNQFATGNWTVRSLRNAAIERGLRYRATARLPERPISNNGIHGMLRNPFYAGILVYKDIEYPGDHEPLITPEVFDRIQNVLDGNNTTGSNKSWQHPHYLKGTLYCARCNQRLCFTRSRGNGGTYEYYYCGGRQRRNGCDLPNIPVYEIEVKIEAEYRKHQLTKPAADLLESVLSEQFELVTQTAAAQLAIQRKRLDGLERRRDKLLQAHYADAITIAQLKAEQHRLTRETIDAQTLHDQARSSISDPIETVRKALRFSRLSADTYLRTTTHGRRELNHVWFERISIDDEAPTTSQLTPALATLLDPQLPELVTEQTERIRNDHDLPNWEDIMASLNLNRDSTDTAGANGSKVPILVGAEGLEPPTSAL